ncbi:MAG: hypothetical protein ACK4PI_04530 [Tepidisphaerales bacterium]
MVTTADGFRAVALLAAVALPLTWALTRGTLAQSTPAPTPPAGSASAGAAGASTPSAGASTPSTRPATPPTAQPADQLLSQMLRPAEQAARPLTPLPQTDLRDATSGQGAAAPNAPSLPLLREGTFVVDRTGRLLRSGEGFGFEFVFESDGRTLRDPPMIILPNSRLQMMEEAVRSANRNLRFRVTGMVTEYRGRNGLLIEKAVVIPDVVQQN